MRAWIDNQKGVGYVVCWLENRINTPLRNFGQMQSAAFRGNRRKQEVLVYNYKRQPTLFD